MLKKKPVFKLCFSIDSPRTNAINEPTRIVLCPIGSRCEELSQRLLAPASGVFLGPDPACNCELVLLEIDRRTPYADPVSLEPGAFRLGITALRDSLADADDFCAAVHATIGSVVAVVPPSDDELDDAFALFSRMFIDAMIGIGMINLEFPDIRDFFLHSPERVSFAVGGRFSRFEDYPAELSNRLDALMRRRGAAFCTGGLLLVRGGSDFTLSEFEKLFSVICEDACLDPDIECSLSLDGDDPAAVDIYFIPRFHEARYEQ